MEDKHIFRRIKELRLENNFTQAQVAQSLSVSVRSYSNLEEGKVKLRTAMLIKLADFYDTIMDYIVEITDYKKLIRKI